MPSREVRVISTGESAGLVRSFEVAGAAAETAQTKMERMQSVGRGMTSLGRSMTSLAVPILAVGGYAVKSAATFQAAMTTLRTQVGLSEKQMSSLGRAAQAMAPGLGEGPNALAAALYPITSVGLRGAAALSALKAAAMGAQVSGASLTDTADAVSGALRTQLKDVRSASDGMSIMNGIVAQGKMHLTDLVGAMTTGILPSAKLAGLGFRDVGDALAAMTRQGIPAQAEATRLRLNLTQFEAPKAGALKALAAIGLGQFSLADDMRKPHGLIAALTDLRAHLSGLSKDQQAATLSTAFGGARGSANVAGLLNALPMMQRISGQLAGSNAVQLATAFGLRTKDVAFQWDKLKATAQTALIGFGNSLMPIVTWLLPKLITGVKDVVGWVTHLPGPVKDVVVGFTLFLAIGGPILMFFGSLITAITTVKGALIAMKLESIATSTVMKASIIGLLVFALVELVTHFKEVRTIAVEVFGELKSIVMTTGQFIGSVFTGLYHVISWPFVTAWKIIKGVFNAIVGAVKWAAGIVVKVWGSTPLGGAFNAVGSLMHGDFVGAAKGYLHGMSFGLLHAGGPVRGRTHFDTGGPVGTDTIPGWLITGRGRAEPCGDGPRRCKRLNTLNDGSGLGGGNISITPGQVVVQVQGRTIAEAVVQYTLQRAARGPTSLVGGAMLTGSRTA